MYYVLLCFNNGVVDALEQSTQVVVLLYRYQPPLLSGLPVVTSIINQNSSCVRVSLCLPSVEPHCVQLTIVIGHQLSEEIWVAAIADADVWF